MDAMGSQQTNGHHQQQHEDTDSNHAPATTTATTISTIVLLSHPIQIVVGLLQVYPTLLTSFSAHIRKKFFSRTKVTNRNHRWNMHTHFSGIGGWACARASSVRFYSSIANEKKEIFIFFSCAFFLSLHLFRFAFVAVVRLTGSEFMGFCSVLTTCLNG